MLSMPPVSCMANTMSDVEYKNEENKTEEIKSDVFPRRPTCMLIENGREQLTCIDNRTDTTVMRITETGGRKFG